MFIQCDSGALLPHGAAGHEDRQRLVHDPVAQLALADLVVQIRELPPIFARVVLWPLGHPRSEEYRCSAGPQVLRPPGHRRGDIRPDVRLAGRCRAEEDFGDQGYGGHGHDGSDAAHQGGRERLQDPLAFGPIEVRKAFPIRPEPVPSAEGQAGTYGGDTRFETAPVRGTDSDMGETQQSSPGLGGQASQDPNEAARPRPCVGSRGAVTLGEEVAILEHPVVVEPHRHEDDISTFGNRAFDEGVHQPHLGGPRQAIPAEPTFEEDALAQASPGNEVDVAAQDLVVERVLLPAPDEVRAETLEEPLERPDTRPLTDRVAQRDRAAHGQGEEHIVGVAAVVHDVDDGAARRWVHGGPLQALGVPRHVVEDAHGGARDAETKLVVGDEVEIGNDLLDVRVEARPHGFDTDLLGASAFDGERGQVGVVQQALANPRLLHELEAVEADAVPGEKGGHIPFESKAEAAQEGGAQHLVQHHRHHPLADRPQPPHHVVDHRATSTHRGDGARRRT